jgi:hypothetical protein
LVDKRIVQIKLTKTNHEILKRFITASKTVDPEYNVKRTAIVNMMFGEKLREELKRFERKKP